MFNGPIGMLDSPVSFISRMMATRKAVSVRKWASFFLLNSFISYLLQPDRYIRHFVSDA
jgi:hypothetical protein